MASHRPRILYLTHNCPHAKSYGAQLRTLHIGRRLQEYGEVRLALLALGEIGREELSQMEAEFDSCVISVIRGGINGTRNRLRHELDPRFLDTHGRSISNKDREVIMELVSSHDVVWLHNVAVPNAAGIEYWPKSVLDVDDVLSRYYQSAAQHTKVFRERLQHWRRMCLWKRREARLLDRFKILAVCSNADRRYMGSGDRVHVIPNGFETPAPRPVRRSYDSPRIGFIGNLTYMPNHEGIQWFISDVWPRLVRVLPTARFRIIGAGSECVAPLLKEGIDALGWVPDPSDEIATWSLMVVPVRVGGGTRLKVVEGFSRKCPMVATAQGAFGYDVISGQEILLADAPDEFAAACLSILRDSSFAERLATNAWNKYLQNWTWDAIAPCVHAAVEDCLRHSVASRQKKTGLRSLADKV